MWDGAHHPGRHAVTAKSSPLAGPTGATHAETTSSTALPAGGGERIVTSGTLLHAVTQPQIDPAATNGSGVTIGGLSGGMSCAASTVPWGQMAGQMMGPALTASRWQRQVADAWDVAAAQSEIAQSYPAKIRATLHQYFGVTQAQVASRLLFLLVPYVQILRNWTKPRARDVSLGEFSGPPVPIASYPPPTAEIAWSSPSPVLPGQGANYDHRSAGRNVHSSGINPSQQGVYGVGSRDENQQLTDQDLYVPVMAFVTYIILYGWLTGTRDSFSPSKLYERASLGLGIAVAESMLFLMVKAVWPSSLDLGFLDAVAITGYKFVHLSAMCLGSIICGDAALGLAWGIQAYLYIACFVAMVMSYASRSEDDTSMEWAKGRAKTIPWVVSSAAVQILLCVLLSPRG